MFTHQLYSDICRYTAVLIINHTNQISLSFLCNLHISLYCCKTLNQLFFQIFGMSSHSLAVFSLAHRYSPMHHNRQNHHD